MSKARMPGLTAAGTIAPARFVNLDTTTNFAVNEADAGEPVFGVGPESQKYPPGGPGSDNAIAAEAGDQLEVKGPGEVAYVVAGSGGTTVGAWVKSDADGKAVIHSTGAAFVGGYALTAVAAGALAQVYVWPSYISL